MISTKEAYNISFVNDECNEYLDEIEREIRCIVGILG